MISHVNETADRQPCCSVVIYVCTVADDSLCFAIIPPHTRYIPRFTIISKLIINESWSYNTEFMARGGRWGQKLSSRKGTFDPQDTKRVKHTRLGVWDLYEEIDPRFSRIPGSSRIEHFLKIIQDLSYVWRLIKDVLNVRGCWHMVLFYMILELLNSLIPAVRLWWAKWFYSNLSMPKKALKVLRADAEDCTYSRKVRTAVCD